MSLLALLPDRDSFLNKMVPCIQVEQVDVLPSKNQALCEFCTHVNQLKHC